MPKVSIIMGIYNGEERMDEAISSICAQTFKDWEFIICDDGSCDHTFGKLMEWAKREPRIRILKNENNKKLATTLNTCLEVSEGEYIARMDDDDFSYPERLKLQVDFLDEHEEYAFVSSLVDCFDGEKIVKNHFLRIEKPQKKSFLSGTQFVHPATMFRKSCLDAVDGYRTAWETRRVEDYDLFMRLYAAGFQGYNIQIPLLRYFVNPEAMQKKRLYRYRLNEAVVRMKGFTAMGLMPLGFPYVLRPLIVGLIPHKLLWYLAYKKREQ